VVKKGWLKKRLAYSKYERNHDGKNKALTILEPVAANVNTKAVKFEKPAAKSAVKLISADNLDELINLLHNEAKVI
jgi:electron transfer flavoprotein beta subunit